MYTKCHTQHKYIKYYVWRWMTESNCDCCMSMISPTLIILPSPMHFICSVIIINCRLLVLPYMSQSCHCSLQLIISYLYGIWMHQQSCNQCWYYYCSKTGHHIILIFWWKITGLSTAPDVCSIWFTVHLCKCSLILIVIIQ